MVDAGIKYDNVDKFIDREKILAYITRNIERFINSRHSKKLLNFLYLSNSYKKPSEIKDEKGFIASTLYTLRISFKSFCFCIGKPFGNYLVILYMLVKTLWLTNAVSQLFLLNHFIGNDYHAFGFEVIKMLLTGQEWNEFKHFPRVTYCDFKIREIGNYHDWTVQCILRINLFNEVIYIFMWFWLCLLAICSIIDYFIFLFRFLPSRRLEFITNHLDINLPCFEEFISLCNSKDKFRVSSKKADLKQVNEQIREFTFSYLKNDCIFTLQILSANVSDLIVTEIVSKLWDNFMKNNKKEDLTYNDDDRIDTMCKLKEDSRASKKMICEEI